MSLRKTLRIVGVEEFGLFRLVSHGVSYLMLDPHTKQQLAVAKLEAADINLLKEIRKLSIAHPEHKKEADLLEKMPFLRSFWRSLNVYEDGSQFPTLSITIPLSFPIIPRIIFGRNHRYLGFMKHYWETPFVRVFDEQNRLTAEVKRRSWWWGYNFELVGKNGEKLGVTQKEGGSLVSLEGLISIGNLADNQSTVNLLFLAATVATIHDTACGSE